jgi:hypothetical protein
VEAPARRPVGGQAYTATRTGQVRQRRQVFHMLVRAFKRLNAGTARLEAARALRRPPPGLCDLAEPG